MKFFFDYPIYKNKYHIAEISRSEHDEWYESTPKHFENNQYAFAIKAIRISLIKKPKDFVKMKEMVFFPPQNYTFLNEYFERWTEE